MEYLLAEEELSVPSKVRARADCYTYTHCHALQHQHHYHPHHHHHHHHHHQQPPPLPMQQQPVVSTLPTFTGRRTTFSKMNASSAEKEVLRLCALPLIFSSSSILNPLACSALLCSTTLHFFFILFSLLSDSSHSSSSSYSSLSHSYS